MVYLYQVVCPAWRIIPVLGLVTPIYKPYSSAIGVPRYPTERGRKRSPWSLTTYVRPGSGEITPKNDGFLGSHNTYRT